MSSRAACTLSSARRRTAWRSPCTRLGRVKNTRRQPGTCQTLRTRCSSPWSSRRAPSPASGRLARGPRWTRRRC